MPASTTALAEAPETIQGLLIWGAEKWSDRPFIHFEDGDVVRHHLVQRIIRAYDSFGRQQAELPLGLAEGEQPQARKPQ